jgi:hypothetical protein
VRLWALWGEGPLTDIGALQAWASQGTLFQVASQFNCLEAPEACVVPVRRYLSDPTQGPRAAVSAFPGTLLRHFAAPGPGGVRFVQTEERQLDLLADALPPEVGRVRCGYLEWGGLADPARAAAALEERFDQIRVGAHDEVEVVLGYAWDGAVDPGRRLAQVCTSTLAGGGYSPGLRDEEQPLATALCRQLLRAANLGTLLAALALGKQRVVLTLIGGGVFGNPHALIWETICWAVDQVIALGAGPLEVVVNARRLEAGLVGSPDSPVDRDTAARGGRAMRAG